MNWITRRLFGRLPVGWLQLRHHRMRLAAAVAGVAFANMLVFVQLGILSAMNDVVRTSYSPFRADIVISPSNANTLTDGATLARRVVYQAIAQPGVAAAAPLYVGQVAWERPNVPATSLIVYALPPESKRFAGAAIAEQLDAVSAPMRAILDALSRDVDPAWAARASPDTPLEFEVDGKAIAAIGSYSMGAGFGWDGSLVVSDLTFMRLIRQRSMGTPSHVLVDLESGMEVAPALAQLRAALSMEPVKVRSFTQAVEDNVSFQATEVPMGSIVGAGVLLGLLVGVVIVYQVLATDVAAHLRDYATFKAIGYSHPYILGVIFEQALILAVLGFLPGLASASAIYALLAHATDLPFGMDVGRSLTVFVGTLMACMLSGALAARRLRTIDPAELF
ncbi:MAG: FtsX-like permease family protein [Pseudoxanthomonas sp.]|nr:FtsX-like permease family protein [Pseudoxanthomonas sp.]